jgi:hypothetical protein
LLSEMFFFLMNLYTELLSAPACIFQIVAVQHLPQMTSTSKKTSSGSSAQAVTGPGSVNFAA